MIFSPKQRFQRNKENLEAWAKLTSEPLLHTVLNDALAEMSFRFPPPTQEMLVGVNNYLAILLLMAEPISPPAKPLPAKPLTSWDKTVPETPPETEKK